MRRLARLLGLLGLVALVGSVPSPGQTRTIAVEGWEVRINERQPPGKVMEAIGVKPGMVVGEVGAGTGRATVWLADRVGPKGKVYANDIDEKALRHLAERCAREGLGNVTTIVGTVDDPRLPAGTLDIAFMTNTYHHLEKPVDLVRNIRPALKPGGILAIVERDADRSVHKQEATRPEDFVRQMDEAGFEVVQVDKSMIEDNVYIARLKTGSDARR
jgi:SAM-dependent methyltransferase